MKRLMITSCVFAVACLLLGIRISTAGKPPKPGDETGPSYSLVTLGDEAEGVVYDHTFGVDMNASNVVAGRVHLTGIGEFAACWNTDGNLKILNGAAYLARGLNDNSEIVGMSGQDAVYWSSIDAVPKVLPRLEGYVAHAAVDINNSGVICGTARNLMDDTVFGRPIVWRVLPNGEIAGPFELPMLNNANTEAGGLAVNEEKHGVSLVVGEAYSTEVGYTAVAWAVTFVTDSVEVMPTELDVGNHARASAVNNANEVVGKSIDGAPMYWSGEKSHTLTGLSPDNPWGWAHGINNSGVIVGQSWHYERKGKQIMWEGQVAAVWPTPESDPILLIPINGSVWGGTVWNDARAINDAGVILVNHAGRASLAFPQ